MSIINYIVASDLPCKAVRKPESIRETIKYQFSHRYGILSLLNPSTFSNINNVTLGIIQFRKSAVFKYDGLPMNFW